MFGFGRKKPQMPKVTWHVPEGTGDFLVPKRATEGAMAFDIISPSEEVVPPMTLAGAGTTKIKTLIAVTIPEGYGIILGSRSSLAAKHSLTVEAGWIDSDYRGIIHVVLYNHSNEPYKIHAGERIAQAMLVKIPECDIEVTGEYPDEKETARGAGGFGSTGR